MRKKTFLLSALILTVTSLILRTVGISFNVYISNVIGPEGMGLFGLIFSTYILAVNFATSGIILSVMRLVSEETAKGNISLVNTVIKKCILISVILSVSSGLILYNCSTFIGLSFLHDIRTILPLKILSISLPFIAVNSCLRGYLFAKRKIIKYTSGDIFEMIVKIIMSVNMLYIFAPKGLEFACCGIVIGSTFSEMLSCLYTYIMYKIEKNNKMNSYASSKGLLKKIVSISLPVALSAYLRSSLKAVENVLIPIGLQGHGLSQRNSLAFFGLLTGMVLPILYFPISFLSSFADLLIPELSEANAINNRARINYAGTRVFQITLLFSILIMGIFFSFSDNLSLAIYKNLNCAVYIKVLAPLIPLMYLDYIVDSMLKALNEQLNSLKYNTIDSLLRILLIWFLLPTQGSKGLITVLFFSTILNSSLSIRRLLKVTVLKVKITDWILKPIFSITFCGLIVNLIFTYASLNSYPAGILVAFKIITIMFFYLILLILTQSLDSDDLSWFFGIFKCSKKSALKSRVF